LPDVSTAQLRESEVGNEAVDLTKQTRVAAEAMYGAVKGGDLATFLSFVSPAIVVDEPDFLPYGGQYEGIDGLQRLFGEFAIRFDLSGLDIKHIVVDGQEVCAICEVPTASGRSVVEFIEHATYEDGKAVRLRIYMHHFGDLVAAVG
jgi:hypothetical protein